MLIQEMPWRPPEDCIAPWADDPHVAWLDSGDVSSALSRYSYLCIDPFHTIQTGPAAFVEQAGRTPSPDPFAALEAELRTWRLDPVEAPVPFIGGAVGFLGYELGRFLEKTPQIRDGRLNIPDMSFSFYDLTLAFDAKERRAWALSSGLPCPPGPAREMRAQARAAWAIQRLSEPPRPRGAVPPLDWRRGLARADYLAKVEKVLAYIRAGDIYQANLTTRFIAARPANLQPFDLYRQLRGANPAPFSAYLRCGERLALASVSPERFVRLGRDGAVEARPIKGTRPRGSTPALDIALARELATSAKDRAENLMIVDLLRNDISRVAAIGSVKAPVLCAIESYRSVHHLTSSVEGRLREGLGPVDLLRAVFPGGSITGAPKIRAMEIIAELESAPRGPYCGAIAWIGFDGEMDSSIAIRTLVATPEAIVAHAGGGVVADSIAEDEFEEMMVKASPLLSAVGIPPV